MNDAATILVVDDDALINAGMLDILTDLGHRTLDASSGRAALAILASGEVIDIMLTDYSMPGMTGLELAREARRLRPDLRVVLMSGYDDLPNGDVTDLPRLAKPFAPDDLTAMLERMLAA